MKNRAKIAAALIIVISTLFLTGFTTRPRDILTFLRKLKVESVSYGRIYITKPGTTFNVNKKLSDTELESLVRLLNKSKDVRECRFPISKGGFAGIILHMKSGHTLTLNSTEHGFCLTSHNRRLEIIQPEYRKFFHSLLMKYTR